MFYERDPEENIQSSLQINIQILYADRIAQTKENTVQLGKTFCSSL